jgi:undecaprenyl-diphosphatase
MIVRIYKKFRELFPVLEPIVLVAFTLLGLSLLSFLEIAEEVGEGETHTIDTKLLMLLRDGTNPQNPLGPDWVFEMVRDISSLGGIAILALVTVSAAVYLLMIKKWGQAAYLVATVGIGTALSNALKFGYARPRPDLVPHGSYVFTGSFPSGHSMMSALVFLSVGMMLARAQKTPAPRIFFLGLSVFLTVLVGVSRVYLGVHWPSDVLAGWLAGGGCAIAFWLVQWLWEEKNRKQL